MSHHSAVSPEQILLPPPPTKARQLKEGQRTTPIVQGLLGKGQPRVLILLRSKFGIMSSCGSLSSVFENTGDQRGAWVGVFLQTGGQGGEET